MIFKLFEPSPCLKPWVRNYLLVNLEGPTIAATPYPARIEQALVFFSRGYIESYDPLTNQARRISKNAIFGQQVARLNFQSIPEGDFLMMMVVFQPGGLYRLLRIPQQELCTQYMDAECFMHRELQSVNEQLAGEDSYDSMIRIVDSFMIKRCNQVRIDGHGIDRIAMHLLGNDNQHSLDWLSGQANLSPRQFERKFQERIGIGPKLFCRINRFYHALSFKESHPGADWLTVALQYGYSDYYHLAKDFRQFGNTTPKVVAAEFSKWAERLRI